MKRPLYPTIRISFLCKGVDIDADIVTMDLPDDPRITVGDEVRHVDKSGNHVWYRIIAIEAGRMEMRPWEMYRVITITDDDRLAIHKPDIHNPIQYT